MNKDDVVKSLSLIGATFPFGWDQYFASVVLRLERFGIKGQEGFR